MELKEAIEILNQCTNDWNELCHCVFKDADEKDYKCVGCREKALEVALNYIAKQEKMIDLMSRFIDTELSSEHLSKVLKINVKPLETYRENIKQYFEKKAEENE